MPQATIVRRRPHRTDAHDTNPGLPRSQSQTPVSLVVDVAAAFYGPRGTVVPESAREPRRTRLSPFPQVTGRDTDPVHTGFLSRIPR